MDNQASALAGLGQVIPFGVFMAPAQTIEELEERVAELIAEAEEISARAESEDISEEELAKVKSNKAEVDRLNRLIEVRSIGANFSASRGRKTTAEPGVGGAAATKKVDPTPRRDDPRNGFKSFGEFALAARHGSIQGNTPDNRLLNAATTYGTEGTGADGGFAVPAEYSREIWQKVMGEDSLASRCDQLVTGSNNMTIPKDETTPWQTSGGVQVYWEAEAATASQSKPNLDMTTIRLNKLMALVPVSEELLEDAPGMESYLRAKAPSKMQSKLNTAIVRGTGAGQPRGILAASSLISVAKETSQTAATLNFQNINKMWSRMYAPARRNSVWLINQDVEPQLEAMEFSPGSVVPIPVYLGPGGASDTPYGRLKGRPVVPVSACSTLGTQGDIILVDLQQYMLLTKGQQVRTDTSMHLYFDQGLMAFRFTFRVNGQPWWGSTITPENGSNTLSWAVTLDARA